jgi:glycosyltransferase involved in cell wall biosynthesis
MISIVLTAWKEEGTAGKAAKALLSSVQSLGQPFEFILVCPDDPTRRAVEKEISREDREKFIYIKDPQKGKPNALNLAFAKAKGEIIVSTDGDVIIVRTRCGICSHLFQKRTSAV